MLYLLLSIIFTSLENLISTSNIKAVEMLVASEGSIPDIDQIHLENEGGESVYIEVLNTICQQKPTTSPSTSHAQRVHLVDRWMAFKQPLAMLDIFERSPSLYVEYLEVEVFRKLLKGELTKPISSIELPGILSKFSGVDGHMSVYGEVMREFNMSTTPMSSAAMKFSLSILQQRSPSLYRQYLGSEYYRFVLDEQLDSKERQLEIDWDERIEEEGFHPNRHFRIHKTRRFERAKRGMINETVSMQ